MFDPRISPKKWVEDKIASIVDKLFAVRRQVEGNMSREELIAYDMDLANQFEEERFMERLNHELDEEKNHLALLRQVRAREVEDKYEQHLDMQKMNNAQDFINNEIKNEDAHYKKMTRDLLVHQKLKADEEVPLNPHGFDAFYDTVLQKDIKLSPRPINEDDYLPKSFNPVPRSSTAQIKAEITSMPEYDSYLRKRLELSHK